MPQIPEPDPTPHGPTYEGRLLARPEEEVVDQGVGFDLGTLVTRRRILALLGIGAGGLALAACGSDSGTSGSGAGGSGTTSTASAGEIPQETNGPYPADGTNGLNVLEQSGIVRRDITPSLDGSVTADGVPMTFSFTVTDLADGAPMAGAAVYLWQCDARGQYSMYSTGLEDVTYLRGVQVADDDGVVTFDTIVPGCYRGRWAHLHFEVYPDLDSVTTAENAIATSQVAFPEDMLGGIYALDTYAGSAENLAQITLATDTVFSDGTDLQMGTFTGSASKGYTGSLDVAIDLTTTPSMGSGMGGGPGDGGAPPAGGPPSR